MKHTPGPWEARQKPNSGYAEVYQGGSPACIAEVFNHDPGAMNNARLIAAAPDLLEAAQAAAYWMEANPDDCWEQLGGLALAIAKATRE